jgi:osmoprotectant transport system substrate-binding protein
VVRRQATEAVPRLAEAIEAVNRRLDNAAMQELNRQVDQDGDEPREVAGRFLAGLRDAALHQRGRGPS